MRVLIIAPRFPMLSQTFVINHVTGLLERGVDVEVLSFDGPSPDTVTQPAVERFDLLTRTFLAPRHSGAKGQKEVVRLLLKHGRQRLGVVTQALNPLRFGRDATSLRLFHAAITLLDRRPYDLVHCEFGMLGLVAARLRRIGALRGKLAVSFRGVDLTAFVQRNGPKVYHPLFRTADALLPNCEYFRRKLLEMGAPPEKIRIFRSSLDVSALPFKSHFEKSGSVLRLLTVGRLVEKKGIPVAIEAVSRLRRRGIDARYAIIGEGPERGRLSALVRKHDLEEHVKLLGPKPAPDVVRAMCEADILLAPSVTASSGDQEGPVNAVKEAMAIGVPVVATNHGGIPEAVIDGKTGYLVPERSPEAICDRVYTLLNERERWPEIARAARAHVESLYDSRRVNDGLLALYQRLIGGGVPV